MLLELGIVHRMDNDQLKRRAGSSSSAGSGQGKIAESSSSGTRGYGQGGRRRDEGRYQTDRTTVTAGRVRPQSNLLLRKWRSTRGHRVALGHTGRDTEAGEEVLRSRRRIGMLREALVAPLEDDDGEVESRTATTTRSLVATPTTERKTDHPAAARRLSPVTDQRPPSRGGGPRSRVRRCPTYASLGEPMEMYPYREKK